MSKATDKVMRRGSYSRKPSSSTGASPSPKPAPADSPLEVEAIAEADQDLDQGLVEALSTMTQEELDQIPGFGKATIADIIKIREDQELTVEQLLSLLGESRYKKAKDYISKL